jgi:transcriptional regulator with XRE-family HTH domain
MIHERIKAYLKKNNIRQTDLAKKTHLSDAAISMMLNGKRGILADEYFDICAALGVPLITFAREGTNGTTARA